MYEDKCNEKDWWDPAHDDKVLLNWKRCRRDRVNHWSWYHIPMHGDGSIRWLKTYDVISQIGLEWTWNLWTIRLHTVFPAESRNVYSLRWWILHSFILLGWKVRFKVQSTTTQRVCLSRPLNCPTTGVFRVGICRRQPARHGPAACLPACINT